MIADGDGTYTLRITGTLTDDSGIGNFNFRFANESNTSDTFWTGTNNFDGSGNFTIDVNLDSTNPGKYFVDYFSVRDGVGSCTLTFSRWSRFTSTRSIIYLCGESYIYHFVVTSVDEESLGLAIGK